MSLLIDNTADRLVERFGRTVTLRQTRSVAPRDPNRPWRHDENSSNDTTVKAAFVPSGQALRADGTVRRSDMDAYLDGGLSLGVKPDDQLIESSGDTWTVLNVREHKPNDQTVGYRCEVSR